MAWGVKKLTFAGIFSVLIWVIYLSISMPLVIAFGLGMGVVVMPFFTLLLLVLFRRIINEAGGTILIGFVTSLLFLPIPAFGPPGFLPKMLILIISTSVIEAVILIFKKWPMLGSVLSGFFGALATVSMLFGIFIFFKIPGSEKFLSLMLPFFVVAMIEGALGGYIAEKIFRKIENRPAVMGISK